MYTKLCILHHTHSLLMNFVELFQVLYGSEFISHNIHNLLHLVNDVKQFGQRISIRELHADFKKIYKKI